MTPAKDTVAERSRMPNQRSRGATVRLFATAGLRALLALAMMLVGTMHFTDAAFFVRIVPPFLPRPDLLVALSGIAEIAGGLGILFSPTRRVAGIGLIALYIAVFPANIYMAVDNVQPIGSHIPTWALWARLPFQFVFIWVAWLVAVRRDARATPSLAPPFA